MLKYLFPPASQNQKIKSITTPNIISNNILVSLSITFTICSKNLKNNKLSVKAVKS